MTSRVLRMVLVAFVTAGGSAGIAAQRPAPSVALGAWFGGEAIPRALDPACGNTSGTDGGWTMGGLASLPVASVAVEGRISRHLGNDYACPGGLVDRVGIHTIRTPDLPGGDFTKTDVRLRVDLGSWFLIGLGGGWAWSKDLPFFASSLGARAGNGIRFGADLEWSTYRIAWLSRTVEFDDRGAQVRVLGTDSYQEWSGAFSLRFVLEVPVGTTN